MPMDWSDKRRHLDRFADPNRRSAAEEFCCDSAVPNDGLSLAMASAQALLNGGAFVCSDVVDFASDAEGLTKTGQFVAVNDFKACGDPVVIAANAKHVFTKGRDPSLSQSITLCAFLAMAAGPPCQWPHALLSAPMRPGCARDRVWRRSAPSGHEPFGTSQPCDQDAD